MCGILAYCEALMFLQWEPLQLILTRNASTCWFRGSRDSKEMFGPETTPTPSEYHMMFSEISGEYEGV